MSESRLALALKYAFPQMIRNILFCNTTREVCTLFTKKCSLNARSQMTLKVYGYHDTLTHFPDSRTFNYAGIFIPAHYLLDTFFGTLSGNSPYNVVVQHSSSARAVKLTSSGNHKLSALLS